nr:MAG TPA: hypothetical protein [Caudoviricetes sp.]
MMAYEHMISHCCRASDCPNTMPTGNTKSE